jgi:hypothetical protein
MNLFFPSHQMQLKCSLFFILITVFLVRLLFFNDFVYRNPLRRSLRNCRAPL